MTIRNWTRNTWSVSLGTSDTTLVQVSKFHPEVIQSAPGCLFLVFKIGCFRIILPLLSPSESRAIPWTFCHPTLDSTSIYQHSDSQLRFPCCSARMALWLVLCIMCSQQGLIIMVWVLGFPGLSFESWAIQIQQPPTTSIFYDDFLLNQLSITQDSLHDIFNSFQRD